MFLWCCENVIKDQRTLKVTGGTGEPWLRLRRWRTILRAPGKRHIKRHNGENLFPSDGEHRLTFSSAVCWNARPPVFSRTAILIILQPVERSQFLHIVPRGASHICKTNSWDLRHQSRQPALGTAEAKQMIRWELLFCKHTCESGPWVFSAGAFAFCGISCSPLWGHTFTTN